MSVRMSVAVVLASILLTVGSAAGGREGAAPANSVYQLTGVFTDQGGAAVRLDVHRGQPVLMSMFYGSCPDACPLLIAELRRIEASLSPALRANLRVVLVSLDPERDTPAALRQLAERHDLDRARWRLLTGSDESVREVAAVLGVKFRRLSRGVINHSSVIVVLDGRGVVQGRIDGVTPGDPNVVGRVIASLERMGASR